MIRIKTNFAFAVDYKFLMAYLLNMHDVRIIKKKSQPFQVPTMTRNLNHYPFSIFLWRSLQLFGLQLLLQPTRSKESGLTLTLALTLTTWRGTTVEKRLNFVTDKTCQWIQSRHASQCLPSVESGQEMSVMWKGRSYAKNEENNVRWYCKCKSILTVN